MATLKEVAIRAGVSKTQASYVLNGRNLQCVSRERQEQVRRAMSELGYRPHAAARSTRSGRFGAVALLLGSQERRSHLPFELLNGIQDRLVEQDLNLMVVRLAEEKLADGSYVPRLLRESSSDGFLIDYTHGIPPRLLELIHDSGLPAVWINSKQPADSVFPDDYHAAMTAARRLLSVGHTRIAYADFSHGPAYPDPHYSAADRRAGYAQAMLDAGLSPTLIGASDGYDIPGALRAAKAYECLSRVDRPTAVICYSATTAASFYVSAQRLGLSIPRDLSIISFDGQQNVFLSPLAESLIVPHTEVGRQAVEQLLLKVEKPRRSLAPLAVPFTWQSGGSIDSPPGLV